MSETPNPKSESESLNMSNALFELENNVKVVEDFQVKKKFNAFDRFVGFLFLAAVISSYILGSLISWVNLAPLELESGGSYGELLEEQKAVLIEIYRYHDRSMERINGMDLQFSGFDLWILTNPDARVHKLIYTGEEEYLTALEDAGYSIPTRKLHSDSQIEQILLGISVLGYIVVGIIGLGVLLAGLPMGFMGFSPIGILAQVIGPKISFGLAYIVLLGMFVSSMYWVMVYMMPMVEAILVTQDIRVQAYGMLDVLSWGFWANLGSLLVLIGLCTARTFFRNEPQDPEKAKN